MAVWLMLTGLGMVVTPSAAWAAEITVTTDVDRDFDDGECSLKEAIIASNTDAVVGFVAGECVAGQGEDTILIPAGRYRISDMLPTLVDSVTLRGVGSGNAIIDAHAEVIRILEIAILDAGGSVTLDSLSFENSHSIGRAVTIGGDDTLNIINCEFRGNSPGGALSIHQASAFISNSTFIDNTASNMGDKGGAIKLTSAANVSVFSSSFIRNHSNNGGAIGAVHDIGGPLPVRPSTILRMISNTLYANSSNVYGGGIYLGSDVSAQLFNLTMYKNVVDQDEDGTGDGAAVYLSSGASLEFTSNILAGNEDHSPLEEDQSGDVYNADTNNSVSSGGYNFIGSNAGLYSVSFTGGVFLFKFPASANIGSRNWDDDIVGTSVNPFNPMLDSLQNNGGPTLTLLPVYESARISPVIDKGNCLALVTEQRNLYESMANFPLPRIHDFAEIANLGGNGCDVGAVELEPADKNRSMCFPLITENGNAAVICL